MNNTWPIALIVVALLLIVSSRSCTIQPALINWERREKPLFPLFPDRKKDKAGEAME